MNTPAVEQTNRLSQSAMASVNGLADRTLEGLDRLAHLNVETVRTTLAAHKELTDEAISSRSLEWVVTLPSAQTQATLKKALAYWHDASNIAIETVADSVGYGWCTFNDYSRWAVSLIDNAAETASKAGATSLVPSEPDATPAVVEDEKASESGASNGEAEGKRRSGNLVDSSGKPVESSKH